MDQDVKVGIIGDYDPRRRYHIATDGALGHAAAALSISLTSSWIPTQSLTKEPVGENTGAVSCALVRSRQSIRKDGWSA